MHKIQQNQPHSFQIILTTQRLTADKQPYITKDVFPNVMLKVEDNKVSLKQILMALQQTYRISISDCSVYYYLHAHKMYIQCGQTPYNHHVKVEVQTHTGSQTPNSIQLYIKYFPQTPGNCRSLYKVLLSKIDSSRLQQNQESEGGKLDKRHSRTVQRPIEYVIQKVMEWRTIYTKSKLEENKMSLQEAAKQVKISKKSLQDYVLQIRKGLKHGFNFNAHRQAKIGVLRAFNEEHERNPPKKLNKKSQLKVEDEGEQKPNKVFRKKKIVKQREKLKSIQSVSESQS